MVSVITWTKSLMVYFIKLSGDKCVSAPRDVTCCCGGIDLYTQELLKGCVFRILVSSFPVSTDFCESPAGSCATALGEPTWSNGISVAAFLRSS